MPVFQVIGALFQEIAVVFVPQNYSSTQQDLELRADQAWSQLESRMCVYINISICVCFVCVCFDLKTNRLDFDTSSYYREVLFIKSLQ